MEQNSLETASCCSPGRAERRRLLGEKVWVCLLRLLSPLGAEDGCMDGLMDCQACNTKLKFLMMTHQTLLGVKTLKTVYKTMRSLSF